MHPKFRRFPLLSLLYLALAPAHAADTRPNVLFIFSDDLRPELGCYGTAGIKTRNLDALAARSVRFNRAYVQYPLCNPSRTSMLTGRYPTTTGVMTNRLWVGGLHPEWQTLPRFFKANGYDTLRTGKIFHGGIDDFDAWTEGGQKRNFEGPHDNRKTGQIASQSDRIVVLDGEGETHGDYVTATRSIGYLRRAADRSSSRAAFPSHTVRRRRRSGSSISTTWNRFPCRRISRPRSSCPRACRRSR